MKSSENLERKNKKVLLRIFLRLILILISSILTMFFIQWRFFDNDFERAFQFMTGEKAAIFGLNTLILFLIELIISALFKAAWTGVGITFIIAIIISYISASKFIFRGQPVLPEDFMLADQTGTLTKFIDFSSLIRTVLAVLIVIGLTIVLNILSKKIFGSCKSEKGNILTKNFRWIRVLAIIVSIFGLTLSADFVRTHSDGKNQELLGLNSKFIAWNQMLNYEENGFILGFMYNLKRAEIKQPEGYSKEKIAEIRREYGEIEGKNLAESDYNIVVVLAESFYDPEIISECYPFSKNSEISENSMGVPVTEEVIPTVRGLILNQSKNYRTGQMYSTDYGGGTANLEFEADTAMSNFWTNTVPYVNLYPRISSIPSIASVAKEAGYQTIAIHPFSGGMYKRDKALIKEGFNEFITETEMNFTEKDDDRQYINDRSAYRETLKVLEEHKEKTLVSLITMQNHAGYGADGYSTRSYLVSEAPKAGEDMEPFSEDEKNQVEVYLETLHNSDYYLAEFLESLSKSDEKTVVLFYGDHSPGIFSRVNDMEDRGVSQLVRLTPYFIWANFELEGDSDSTDLAASSTLPTTTPNCFMPTLFSSLGLKKPNFVDLAEKVCLETPILNQGYFGDKEVPASKVLLDYELYIYDILNGKKYWYSV